MTIKPGDMIVLYGRQDNEPYLAVGIVAEVSDAYLTFIDCSGNEWINGDSCVYHTNPGFIQDGSATIRVKPIHVENGIDVWVNGSTAKRQDGKLWKGWFEPNDQWMMLDGVVTNINDYVADGGEYASWRTDRSSE